MKRSFLFGLTLVFGGMFSSPILLAQTTDSTEKAEEAVETDPSQKPLEFIFRPTLGLGLGMFTFYGDVADNHDNGHPTVSRVGYDLRLSNPLNDYFDLQFYVVFGKLSANERSLTNPERNLNFQSEIRTGGMMVSYNFMNFKTKKERTLEPYVAVGMESFEFLSKTDLYDATGNRYHYWSDGSIRNLDENDPNAASSILLQRDYIYESDLREQNLDGFGKYRERSWAVPVGVGARLHLNKRWDFRIGTSMHFTFSDLVDNVTEESTGSRAGNDKNDKFLFTHFSVNYDLQRLNEKELPLDETTPEDLFDLLAKDTVDTDEDGVVDFIDFCQYTQKGLEIDVRGCPVDKDKDKIFDYVDDENPSPEGADVTEKGVAITDEMTYERFLRYTDTTGNYTGKIDTVISTKTDIGIKRVEKEPETDPGKTPVENFVVVIGTDEKAVSQADLQNYLAHKEFQMIKKGDTTYYIMGNYDNLTDAVKEKYHLEKEGIKTHGIATTKTDKDGNIIIENVPEKSWPLVDGGQATTSKDEVIYRVQIGAFSKRLSENIFKDVKDLIIIKGEDGLTRYYSGYFDDIYKASERKVQMLDKGFEGAFVVAYQGNKRKPLSDIQGVEVLINENTDASKDKEMTKIDESKIKYRVQVGAFKSDVPTHMLNKFLTIGGVTPQRIDDMTKYFSGNFNSQSEATAALQKIVSAGLPEAFVVADYNGKILTLQELKDLMGK